MLKSMTGYGVGKSKLYFGTIIAEIKTLNRRYLEIAIKLPESIQDFEKRIKNLINKRIKRGKVNITLNLEDDNKDDFEIKINKDIASKYILALRKLRKDFKLDGRITLKDIVDLPDIVEYKTKKRNLAKYWPKIKRATERALSDLVKSRKDEGRIIYKDFSKRVKTIKKLLDNIKERLPDMLSYKKQQFLDRLTGSNVEGLDNEKLNLDLTSYIRNSDITEEVTRINAHIKNFKNSLRFKDEVGRKLDFIAQELNREANTISAKSQDYQISKAVIEIKSEIEKIREQVQNVE